MEDEHRGQDDHDALESVGECVCYWADLVQDAEGKFVVQVEQHAYRNKGGLYLY